MILEWQKSLLFQRRVYPKKLVSHLGRDLLEQGIINLPPEDGAVRLNDNASLLAILHDGSVLAERMELDNSGVSFAQKISDGYAIRCTDLKLIYRGDFQTSSLDFFDVMDATEGETK